MGAKERARLRQQAKHKKEQLDRLREQQNAVSADCEVTATAVRVIAEGTLCTVSCPGAAPALPIICASKPSLICTAFCSWLCGHRLLQSQILDST